MSKPWVRLYRDAILKPKVGKLTLEQLGFWAACLMLSDDDGNLPPVPDMAWQLRLTEEVVEKGYLASLVRHGLVTRDVTVTSRNGSQYRLHDWDTHQMASDGDPTARERKQRQREREKAQSSAVTRDVTDDVTVGHANVTRTDTDTDTDTDKTTHYVRGQNLTVAPNNLPPDPVVLSPRPKNATAWPSEAVVPYEWIADAIDLRAKQGKGPIDYGVEADRFCNHFAGNGKRMKDWRRTWLNWCTSPFVDQLTKGATHGKTNSAGKTVSDLFAEIDGD